jgi:polysaccharide deacetylase family protein (PEP-CTERM system associated)
MSDRPAVLLSVDFEDWHQLVRRRVGVPGWERPGPALARQTETLLALLDELQAKATFFVLGMAARAHPDLVRRVAAAGHEIGCHGDAHLPVHSQTPEELGRDLRAATDTIQALTGQTPRGYRAPAFSITAQTPWAYDVLADHGFAYDASEHDTPRIRDRVAIGQGQNGPHPIHDRLYEFPVAVGRLGRARVPAGGASYWSVLPTPLIVKALERAGPTPGLYLHPNELDPQPLDPELPPAATASQRAHARLRAVQRNAARRRAPGVLRAIARDFQLITYGEAHAKLGDGSAAGPQ